MRKKKWWKYIENYDNKALMRIQFILDSLYKLSKPLSHSCYILRIENSQHYWLIYSDDLLGKIIEKCDTLSYKPFFKP